MLVDKIDFVEFDRQWRGLFDDGCDYELVVNGVPAERKDRILRTKYTETSFTQWGKEGSAFFLSWAHNMRNREVTLSFRKKPEPMPEGWRQEKKYPWHYSKILRPNWLGGYLSMYALVREPGKEDSTISSYVGQASLVYKVLQPGTSPAQAAKQCEEATVVALHDLISEITHTREV